MIIKVNKLLIIMDYSLVLSLLKVSGPKKVLLHKALIIIIINLILFIELSNENNVLNYSGLWFI